MLPKACVESALYNIDPLYSTGRPDPPDPSEGGEGYWLYGQYEYEAFVLERMFREKNEAKLKVGYTEFRKVPEKALSFSASFEQGEKTVLKTTGQYIFKWQGEGTLFPEKADDKLLFIFPAPGVLTIEITVADVEKDIPALYVAAEPRRWRCFKGGQEITPVRRNARRDGVPPHHGTMVQVELDGVKIRENVWDARREILAYVEVSVPKGETPEIFVGESIPEMENNDPAHEEQTRELELVSPGLYRSKVPLAFRYLRVEKGPHAQVRFKALFHPAACKGAFSAPETPELTKIWMHSAYTLRLCMMNFLNDGIKRDRLPWAGDLAVSLLGNYCSYADNTIVRDTLSVLGAVSVKIAHINTIVDYTLWHLVSHDLYQRYSGDREFLAREYPRLRETLELLLERRDPAGLLPLDPAKDWIFIDWVEGEKQTALQMLFIMALRAGAALAHRMDDTANSSRLLKAAETAQKSITAFCFDREKQLFAAAPGSKEFSRHANMFAVVSGVADDEMKQHIADALEGESLPPVGTPYMSVFESLALARCGRTAAALAKVHTIWGGMLAQGATTFWEGFDPAQKDEEHLVFYTRPYGKSLCHAWSSGPLFLLPEIFLQLHPEKDGWEEFSIAPLPGVTVSAVIPVPGGIIEVECVKGRIVKLNFPDRCRRI